MERSVTAPEPGTGSAAADSRPAPAAPADGDETGQAATGQPDSSRLPWAGRPRAADIACWAGITLSGVYYLSLLPFRAELVGTHPVALEILNGSTEAIIAAAAFARIGHGTLLVVLLAAIPGLMKFDPLYWWAGRLWGERAIVLMGGRRDRWQRYIDRVARWGRKFTWPAIVICPFLPVPNAVIYIIAGWAGVGLVTFLVLDLIGTMLWTGMLLGLGYALGHHAVVVARAVSRDGLWFSIAIIALIIVSQVRSARRSVNTVR
jgi:membrane protein DedA with SNARE-associated domain